MFNLENRLWDSNETERLNRAMPEALALIMFDDLKRQHDASRAFGIRWLDGAAGVNDVEVDGHVDLVSLAQAVLSALKVPS